MSENTTQGETKSNEVTMEAIMQELQSIKVMQKEALGALGCVLTNQLVYLKDKYDGAEDEVETEMFGTGIMATQSCIDCLMKTAELVPQSDIKVMHVKAGSMEDILKAIFG